MMGEGEDVDSKRMGVTWGVTLRSIAVGFITAVTLGPILAYGEMTNEIATQIGMSSTQLSFWTSMQYALFFGSAFFCYLLYLLCQSCAPSSASAMAEGCERGINMLGAIFYIIGYVTPPFIDTNQSAFIGVWFTFVGLGSGMLYWTSISILSSWFESPGAKMFWVGYAASAPSFFLALFPWVYNYMLGQAYTIPPWGVVFTTQAAFGGFMLALSFVLKRGRFDKVVDTRNDDPFVNFYPVATYFAVMFGAFFLQSQAYIPIGRVPPYVLEVVGGTEYDKSATVSLLGWGSFAGRIAATIIGSRFHDSLAPSLAGSATIMSLFYLLWGFQNGLIAVQSFAFLYTFFTGASYVFLMMMMHSYWSSSSYEDVLKNLMMKLGGLGIALGLGQMLSAVLIGYAVPSYTNTIIWAGTAAGVSAVTFIAVALLTVM
jgi:hypothetical protein